MPMNRGMFFKEPILRSAYDVGSNEMMTQEPVVAGETLQDTLPVSRATEIGYGEDLDSLNAKGQSGLFNQKGLLTAGLVSDVLKRSAMMPVLEAEAMFRAFGKGGLTDVAKQGVLGENIVGTLARANAAEKLAERNRLNDQAVRELLKSFEKK